MATGFSDEEEVGLREKCHPARPKAPDMMVSRICIFRSRVSNRVCCHWLCLVGEHSVWVKGLEQHWGMQFVRNIFLGIWEGAEAVSTYVKLGVLAGALLEGVLVGFAAGGRGSVLGARVDARSTERASCAESGASDD
jgi:hypothetical protein